MIIKNGSNSGCTYFNLFLSQCILEQIDLFFENKYIFSWNFMSPKSNKDLPTVWRRHCRKTIELRECFATKYVAAVCIWSILALLELLDFSRICGTKRQNHLLFENDILVLDKFMKKSYIDRNFNSDMYYTRKWLATFFALEFSCKMRNLFFQACLLQLMISQNFLSLFRLNLKDKKLNISNTCKLITHVLRQTNK